ncbi:MAG: phosphatase PAP2 family protein [Planctomyces sp.]|nr:phosphatase PAP2 family protein [Planctomyces sp.]
MPRRSLGWYAGCLKRAVMFMRRFPPPLLRLLRGWEPRALAALLLLAIGAWVSVKIAGEVLEGDTFSFDRLLLELLRSGTDPGALRGPGWLADVVRDATALGSVLVLTIAAGTAVIFLWLQRQRSTAIFLATSVVTGMLASAALKEFFDRPRPTIVPHLATVASSSFPSGHAMMSAVVYLTLGSLLMSVVAERRLKLFILAAAIGVTVLVGVSRVLLGVHYPSDVLAGWAFGLSWAEACWLGNAWRRRRAGLATAAAPARQPVGGAIDPAGRPS